MATDAFLKESWERKAAEETQEGTENSAVELYFDMQDKARVHPELESTKSELEKWIGEYSDSVTRRAQDRSVGNGMEDKKSSDENQKRIHDALIGTVNQLSRAYKKLDLDNSWRQKIIGLSRDDVAAWALDVAKNVLGKKLPYN